MTKNELENKKHCIKNAYKDAKKTVLKGNMFMLAIGLLLGAAFGAVVSSLANDVIMLQLLKFEAEVVILLNEKLMVYILANS